jgi:hypothetical protein
MIALQHGLEGRVRRIFENDDLMATHRFLHERQNFRAMV